MGIPVFRQFNNIETEQYDNENGDFVFGFTHLYPQMQIPLPDTFKNRLLLIRQNLHAHCGSILADFLVCCRHRPCGCFTNEVEPDNG